MADLQRYRIIEQLDEGGMAAVYKAESNVEGFKKIVAIKRILPNLTKDRKFVAMFRDEARLSMMLSHSNIVSVFDVGVVEGAYFIVMDYIEGSNLRSLSQWLQSQGRSLGIGPACYIAQKMCDGLSYAHELCDPYTDQ